MEMATSTKQTVKALPPSEIRQLEWLTKEQFATLFAISERNVERLIEVGRIRAHRLNSRTVRIHRSQIEAYTRLVFASK